MQVRLLDENELGDYQDFVRRSPFGDVLQMPAWARLKSGWNWRPHYLTAENSSGITAACLALERPLPKLPFSLLYCPRGPVLDWNQPEAFPHLVSELRKLASRRRAILIKIDPPVPSGNETAVRIISEHNFVPVQMEGFGGIQPRCVMKLDLSQGLDEAFASFKPKWRYNIRLAERKGVTVREADGSEMDAFYEILLETARRDRFLVRSREYFKRMWEELGKDGLIRLFLAEYEGKVIAGALMYLMGNQAWYTYGASSNEHRNVMPNHLMQWRMMEAAYREGCTVYDFRGVSCRQDDDVEDRLQGLNRFKAGFNAEFIEYIGEYDLPISKPLYIGWTKVAPTLSQMLRRKASSGTEQPL